MNDPVSRISEELETIDTALCRNITGALGNNEHIVCYAYVKTLDTGIDWMKGILRGCDSQVDLN